MPVSVATTNSRLGDEATCRTMPSVERTWVVDASFGSWAAAYMHWLAQPHSGWMSRSVEGRSAIILLTSSGRMPACTWHSPGQIRIDRPVRRSR